MQIFTPKITILLTLLYFLQLISHFVPTQGQNLILLHNKLQNTTNSTYTTYNSPYLTRIKNPRSVGCRRRPWICRQDGDPRVPRRCCRNRCVDVSSDVNNCGLCGVRCRFTRQCCRGLCVNVNNNPYNCGRCGNTCPFPNVCFYGMCGYAQPPFPFPPPRPPRPHPPKPPRPPHPPKPPRPPKPCPPLPPLPPPPPPPIPCPLPPPPPPPPRPCPPAME